MKKNNLEAPPRQRTSVPIQGLDLITPDDTVADGKCQILLNMRYEGGAWRPTHPYTLKKDKFSYTIMYNHIVDGKSNYICKNGDSYYYSNGSTNNLICSISDVIGISHFGNVLIFITSIDTHFYVWAQSGYTKWEKPSYVKTTVTNYQYFSMDPVAGIKEGESDWVEYGTRGWGVNNDGIKSAGSNANALWYPFFNLTQGHSMISTEPNNGYWHGELLLFTTFVMEDGTNIAPSPLHLLKSNTAYTNNSDVVRDVYVSKPPTTLFSLDTNSNNKDEDTYIAIRVVGKEKETTVPSNEPLLQSCKCNLNLSFTLESSSAALIKSVAVWATRVNPILTSSPHYKYMERTRDGWVPANSDLPAEAAVAFATLKALTGNLFAEKEAEYFSNFRQHNGASIIPSSDVTDYYADNDLANQPFYLLKELTLEDFTKSGTSYSYTLPITKDLLDNSVGNRTYTPVNNVHTITAKVNADYNARLHLANYKTTLFKGFDFADAWDGGLSTTKNVATDITVGGKTYRRSSSFNSSMSNFQTSAPFAHILSYPDSRAEMITLQGYAGWPLKPAHTNSFAWCHQEHTSEEKFPTISYDQDYTGNSSLGLTLTNGSFDTYNKLQVSAANNCFNLPFENNYTIGSSSNKIIAINSPAIEMHEMKIGELPLYVFTEEGIFALQAGANTLYASVVPVNHDKIINPNTLAINNALVYATERGIHMLRGSENVIISTPIHTNGIVPIDVFKTCTFINPKGYNELVVLRSDGSGAYIYNLDSGYWSTRELSGWKLNTDELAYGDGVYDITNEVEDKCLTPQIITRPIKLGTLEYKRIETMIPRIQRTPKTTYGFNCQLLDKWNQGKGNQMGMYTLDQSGLPIGIRRTGSSSQYFTFRFVSTGYDVNIGPDFSISHIDFEWYERFRRRLR